MTAATDDYRAGFIAARDLYDSGNGGVVQRDPIMVQRVGYEPPCSGCDRTMSLGELAMVSAASTEFYCFDCVTQVYEAMTAARGTR